MLRIALAASFTVFLAAPAAAQTVPGGLRVIDVPYVSQSEELCGGAAAAMLMRHAGLRGVYAEDFSSLVDETAGGIAAGDLRRALNDRGFDVESWSGTPALVRRHLDAGVPVMALIEARRGRFHYVVIVAWTAGAVVYHDPARAPFIGATESAFDRAWSVADRWMLVARAKPATRRAAGAEPGAAEPGTAASATHDELLRQFRQRNYGEAIRLAERTVESNAHDADAWRLLAASRYLSGNPAGALEAWNRTAEPRVDLVRVEGLVETPHRMVERLIDIRPASLLTRDTLIRGERRLSTLPSAAATRVSYLALPGGLAEVRGVVVENSLLPSRIEWIAEGIRAAVDREVHIGLTNLAGSGDRLSGEWRFRDLHPRIAATLEFPGARAHGIWSLGASWQREHYAADGPATTTRREATLGWSDWVTSRVRLVGHGGVGRWENLGTAALVRGGVRIAPLDDGWRLSLDTTAAAGPPTFTATSLNARWGIRPSPGWRAHGSVTGAHATSDAPPDAWFGAGTGHGRPLLLRAHPVLVDGRLAGPVFGRTVAQSTIEAQRDLAARPLWSVAVAGFADVARAWHRADLSASPLHADVGIGLRLRLGPGGRTLRIDVARGLRDGKVAVGVGWEGGVGN
jgi:hypothetical protein